MTIVAARDVLFIGHRHGSFFFLVEIMYYFSATFNVPLWGYVFVPGWISICRGVAVGYEWGLIVSVNPSCVFERTDGL